MHFSNISKVYYVSYSKNSLYAGIMQFTPPHPNNISPSPHQLLQQLSPFPPKQKFWPLPPSKDLPEIFNPPSPLPKLEGRVHDLFLEAF